DVARGIGGSTVVGRAVVGGGGVAGGGLPGGAVAGIGRTARFCCVVVVSWPDGREVVATGAVQGHIVDAPRGESGFGYDPVFAPDDPSAHGRTFAEMSPAEKHAISHRGRALRQLAALLSRHPPPVL
ncbi:MAG: hypothetical protein M3Z46_09870, partial [Actinomycetota bacterium]|nr:hypothetical protein [Actinomycetota bacterium]